MLEELHAVARGRPSCRVDVTGRAFLLVQPRRLAPHRIVKVSYRHLPHPIPSPSSFIRCLRGGDDRVTRQHHSRPPCTSSPAAIKARDAAVPPNLPCRRTVCMLDTFTPTNHCWKTSRTLVNYCAAPLDLQPTHIAIAIRPRSDQDRTPCCTIIW